MFDELFPVDMQAYLWSKKAKVKDLIVYADEPFVPWELVHLKPPTGPREEKPRFLAQAGWSGGSPAASRRREMHVRRGTGPIAGPVVQGPDVRADGAGPRGAVPRRPVRGHQGDGHAQRRTHAAAVGRVRPASLLRPRRRRPQRHPRRQAAAAGAQAGGHRGAAVPRRDHRQRERHLGGEGYGRAGRRAQRLPGRPGRRAAHHRRRLRQGVPRRRRLGVRVLPLVGAGAAVAALRGEAVRRAAGRLHRSASPPRGPARWPARPATPPGSPSSSTPDPMPSSSPPEHPHERNASWPVARSASASTSSSRCR